MHSGIGTTSRRHLDGMIGNVRDCGLDRGLNATRMSLRLPAGKRRTVVFDAESDAHLGRRWRMADSGG